MAVKKNDFVEIEFIGRANGEIFDTNIKKKAEKQGIKTEENPLIVCVGQGMLIKGFDKEIEGKELNKEYKIKLSPENAFGKRNPSLIKIIPLNVFKEKNINPVSGLTLNFDGMIARVITVSGGRVITDFNNPLSGKEIEYDFKIKRKVEDEKEKINSLQDFFFKKRFDFEITENDKHFQGHQKSKISAVKDKKVIFKEEKIKPLLEVFNKKFKDATGFNFVAEKKEIKKQKNKQKNNPI